MVIRMDRMNKGDKSISESSSTEAGNSKVFLQLYSTCRVSVTHG